MKAGLSMYERGVSIYEDPVLSCDDANAASLPFGENATLRLSGSAGYATELSAFTLLVIFRLLGGTGASQRWRSC